MTLAHAAKPAAARQRRTPGGGEIAREQTSVGELLGRELALRRHDQRPQRSTLERAAEEEVPRDRLDRKIDVGEQRRRVDAGGDDDALGTDRSLVELDAEAAAVRLDPAHPGDLEACAARTGGVRERVDDGAGTIEVAVLAAVRGSGHALDDESGDELRRLARGDHPRWDPGGALDRDRAAQLLEPLGAVREEEVAAGVERGADRHTEAVVERAVDVERLAAEPAVHARAPLLAHAARLHAARARGDTLPLEHERRGPLLGEVECDREPGDPRSDHHGVFSMLHGGEFSDGGGGVKGGC